MKNKKITIHQQIYNQSLRNLFITNDEAKTIAKNEKNARTILWRLSDQNKLVRAKAGLYGAVPPEKVSTYFEFNRYVLADKAFRGEGGIAYHSALELYGLAYSSFNTIYYLSKKRTSSFEFQNTKYQPVWSNKLFGITKTYLGDIQVNVTDKERTFLDCLRRLDLCGGIEEYLKSVEQFPLLNDGRLWEYLGLFGEQSLFQRTGFVLTLLNDKIMVPDAFINKLHSRVSSNKYYLVPGKKRDGNILNKEWNILIPRNFEEMIKFA